MTRLEYEYRAVAIQFLNQCFVLGDTKEKSRAIRKLAPEVLRLSRLLRSEEEENERAA